MLGLNYVVIGILASIIVVNVVKVPEWAENGVGCMFLFPVIGHLFDMGHVQFGAWAGTGILNSAQVVGAALACQPDSIETLKVAEIFNITRVLVLPIIVVWLAVWYVRREENASGCKMSVECSLKSSRSSSSVSF